jgi:5-oxoprolinase (ATP-hydrolysing)
VAVEQTAQAVRRISTERGFDPRDHALVAFGGAAGQIACAVAEALGINEVLSPRHASLLSAWGIGQAQVGALRLAGLEAALNDDGLARARDLAEALTARVAADLAEQGAEAGTTNVRLRLRYAGADAVLAVDAGALGAVTTAFEAAHQRLFGFVEPELGIVIAGVEVEGAAAKEPFPLDGLRDSRKFVSFYKGGSGERGAEAFPPLGHGLRSWGFAVAVPSAVAGDDPGEPGE